jgi:hypothetical protein
MATQASKPPPTHGENNGSDTHVAPVLSWTNANFDTTTYTITTTTTTNVKSTTNVQDARPHAPIIAF